MPNWKKVITSGSDAALNSLIAPSITGSLQGTASYATQALSSSYAVTSSLPLNGITTASFSDPNITFTKGNGSTFVLDISGLNMMSASYSATASYVLPLVQDVQLTGSLLISGAIQFDTNSSPTMNPGVLAWNSGEGTLQFGLAGGNVDYNVSEQLYQYVFNAEATTLTKGTIVYVSGSQGGRIAVKRADWSAERGSAGTLGFVAEDIASGAEGWVMTEGSLRGVDTSAFTGGQLIFLGDDGTYTATIPTAPSHSVRLGYAQKIDATTGIIYVKIDNGYEIDELHDVRISNKQDGDLLVWNSGSRVWNNAKQLTGSYSITGSLSVSGSTTFNGPITTKTTRITSSIYTASVADYRIGIRYTDTGSVSIQLPLISSVGQIEYRFKDEEGNSTVNAITLVASGSNLIDGSATAILRRNYISIGLYNDGVSNWYIE